MKQNVNDISFSILAYIVITVFSVFTIAPFILILSGSFTSQGVIISRGYSFLPIPFSIDAYKYIIEDNTQILRSYGVSIFVTLIGTIMGLIFCSITAFVVSRRDFKYRNTFSFFFYFTTLFSGGLISSYLLIVRYLHWKNNFLALIVPGLFHVYYIFIMRSFIKSTIPESLIESSKLDGAGYFYIYARIVLPLIKPVLACIGLFYMINYWNDWSNAMLYISDIKKYPLQYLLTSILNKASFLSMINTSNAATEEARRSIPSESFKLAMTIVTIGPIALAYPFMQKYFVKGLTIGAVKG